MAESREGRSARERETLLHSTPEAASVWREDVQERLRAETATDVRRPRELVAEAIAEQFAEAGHGVSLTQPWEHSEAEHQEVQELVNLTFATDLPTALKAARQSPNWPRNLDLFHDVLTTEMYGLVQERRLNRQPLLGWLLFICGVVLGAILVIILLLVFAV